MKSPLGSSSFLTGITRPDPAKECTKTVGYRALFLVLVSLSFLSCLICSVRVAFSFNYYNLQNPHRMRVVAGSSYDSFRVLWILYCSSFLVE